MTMVPMSATIIAGTPIITQMLRGSRSGSAIGALGATRTGLGESIWTRVMGNAFFDTGVEGSAAPQGRWTSGPSLDGKGQYDVFKNQPLGEGMCDLATLHDVLLPDGLQRVYTRRVALAHLHHLMEAQSPWQKSPNVSPQAYLAETAFSNDSDQLEVVNGQR